MQLAALRPLIQGLDVFADDVQTDNRADQFSSSPMRVEHESIIRIGRMAQRKGFSGIPLSSGIHHSDRIRVW